MFEKADRRRQGPTWGVRLGCGLALVAFVPWSIYSLDGYWAADERMKLSSIGSSRASLHVEPSEWSSMLCTSTHSTWTCWMPPFMKSWLRGCLDLAELATSLWETGNHLPLRHRWVLPCRASIGATMLVRQSNVEAQEVHNASSSRNFLQRLSIRHAPIPVE